MYDTFRSLNFVQWHGKFRRASQKTIIRENNWLMAMRDITNMYFDNYTLHFIVIHE